MSLYHYVPGRDEMVDLMMDRVIGEVEFPQLPPPGWRPGLELIAREQWRVFLRHPWLAQALSFSQPRPMPNSLKQTEWALRSLGELELDTPTKLYIAITVFSYVRGCAANLEVDGSADPEDDLTWRERNPTREDTVEEIMGSGQYPQFSEIHADLNFQLDPEGLFEFGLQRMLDGLAVFLANDLVE
jgi:hypothetical protein